MSRELFPSQLRKAQLSRQRYYILIAVLFLVCYLFPLIILYRCSLIESFVDTPREGEAYTSDEEFFACVAERLSYKSDDQARIPYMLIPVTMDYQDLKKFFCNLTVEMTYITLINNGEFKPLRRLLDRLGEQLEAYMNKHLFIIHHPENIGYAAAVNEGLRHAMRYTVKDVPWVMISNSDVRFATSLMSNFTKQVNLRTKDQEDVIRRLDEEVAQEAAQEATAAASASERRFRYRSSVYPVITATSLPYRIRVMRPAEMRRQFKGHDGMFFTNHIQDMATFAISRLLIATVGFFDENFYPAYGEDYDYLWRLGALGFSHYKSPQGQFIHYKNANLKVSADITTRSFTKHSAYSIQSMKFGRMNYQPFRLYYRRSKWFPQSQILIPEMQRQPLPFNGNIPVDMWVLDENRRSTIWKIGENQLCRGDYQYYNMSLLEFTVPPS